MTADFDFDYHGTGWAFGGVAGSGADLLIRIDRGDGSAPFDKLIPLFSLISPVIWGNGASGSGNMTITVPFQRATSSAGKVRVMIGTASHGEAWAFAAVGTAGAGLIVSKICVDSTD